jgi:polysaccharide export outer membrane protein/exopolysaccharide production protein ExoF
MQKSQARQYRARTAAVTRAKSAELRASGPGRSGILDPRRARLPAVVLAGLTVAAITFTILPAHHTLLQASPSSSEYRLGPLDKVRVKVFEWRATRDEVYEWTALNSEFVVNSSGRVALPLIGEIPATGMTTAALARSIGESLRTRMGLVETPDASVEILQYRPFYVTGQIEKPGEYPYRPNLTVLQAASIAGGLQRMAEQGMLRLEREAIATRGDLQLYSMEMSSLLARSARINAEFNGRSAIEFPVALRERASETPIAALMAQEELIHRARMQAFDTNVAALESLKAYLEKEVTSLNAQLEAHDRQVVSMRKDLDAVRTLVSKGLATVSRQTATERAEAQLVGERLRVESNLMKAHQEISRCDLALVELRNKRSTEATTELRLAHSRIEELGRRSDTAENLLYETETIAPMLVSDSGRRQRPQPRYTIVRLRNGQALEIAATEGTPLEPGDTLKIDVPAVRALPGGRMPDLDGPKILSGIKLLSHQPPASGERGN